MLWVHYTIIKAFRACWELQALISTPLQTFPFSCIWFSFSVSFCEHQRNYSFFYRWTRHHTIDATGGIKTIVHFIQEQLSGISRMVSPWRLMALCRNSFFLLLKMVNKTTFYDLNIIRIPIKLWSCRSTQTLCAHLSAPLPAWAGGPKAVWSGPAGLFTTEPAGAKFTHCRKKPFTWITR